MVVYQENMMVKRCHLDSLLSVENKVSVHADRFQQQNDRRKQNEL